MLAHLKAREMGQPQEPTGSSTLATVVGAEAALSSTLAVPPTPNQQLPVVAPLLSKGTPASDGTITIKDETQATCDVLCSLGAAVASFPSGAEAATNFAEEAFDVTVMDKQRKSSKTCPKQHQLPMFLSSKSSMRSRTKSQKFHATSNLN